MKKMLRSALKGMVVLTVAAQLVLGQCAYAAEGFKVVSAKESKQQILVKEDGKTMLKQEWFGMKFEMSQNNKVGTRKMRSVDSKEYEKALSEAKVDFSKLGNYTVYFLDTKCESYKNAQALSFMDDSAVVFGTSKIMSKKDINRLAVHELGHQVAFKMMNEQKWNQYKAIRGLQDEEIYNDNTSEYKNRVQEIFAEDFRLILGGEEAQMAKHLNSGLQNPQENAELVEFFNNMF